MSNKVSNDKSEQVLEPTPYLEKIMRKTEEDLNTGKNLPKVFNTVDDFLADIEKDS